MIPAGMGLLGDLFGGARMKDPVRGTAQVVSCSGYRGRGVMQSCHMQLVVQAEDVPATAVEFQGLVHNKRWPSPGMVLPATIDRANPQTVKIEWDEVASSRERSRDTAEDIAAAMRGERGGSPGAGGLGGATPNVINLSGRDVSDLSEEQRQKLKMLGIDPAALGAAQGQAAAPAQPDDEMSEQLEQLEQLSKLHQDGALTDAEFKQAKKRILDE